MWKIIWLNSNVFLFQKPKKKGDPEPDRDVIIQKLVGELLKEAKITHGNKKDLRHHEEHILLIRLGGKYVFQPLWWPTREISK